MRVPPAVGDDDLRKTNHPRADRIAEGEAFFPSTSERSPTVVSPSASSFVHFGLTRIEQIGGA
jgi:hypothetical protein